MKYIGDPNERSGRMWLGVLLTFIACNLCIGLAAFGIWDPWELDAAQAARRLFGDHATPGSPPVQDWLIAASFRGFGVHEWSGRLPFALAGLFTAAIAYQLVATYWGRRAGLYACAVAATTPLFAIGARSMLGATPSFLIQGVFAWSLFRLTFTPNNRPTGSPPFVWWMVAGASGVMSGLTSGVLLGPLPPLAAVAVSGWLTADARRTVGVADAQRGVLAATTLTAALLVLAVGNAVLADRPVYDVWLGGVAGGSTPPTFEHLIALVFHGFAPWSALLPLGAAALLNPSGTANDGTGSTSTSHIRGQHALTIFMAAWVVFGFAAHSLYLSRYGSTTFVPVVGLAGLVAMGLRTLERDGRGSWPAAIVSAMLVGLLVRDYSLYPERALTGLGVSDIHMPDSFNPRRAWLLIFGAFAVSVALGLGICTAGKPSQIEWTAPYRLLVTQWRRGWGQRAWLIVAGLVLLLLAIAGLAAWFMPEAMGFTTLGRRLATRAMWLPLALALGTALLQAAFWFFQRLAGLRFVPALLIAALGSVYVAHGFVPDLSTKISPREAYQTYNALAVEGEPLAEYRVRGRAAAYYAQGDVREVTQLSALLEFLDHPQRRWLTFPLEEFAEINRSIRRRTGRHLFVVDDQNPRAMLATNHPISDRVNQNQLAEHVRTEVPPAERPLDVAFGDHIELVGYDLSLPHTSPQGGAYVGAGDRLHITWVFKALKSLPGNYQVFVHIDGNGTRIHGDHEPVDGNYPIRFWEAGDVIVDRQAIPVPPNSRPGTYTIYVGLFSGNTRLPVTEGPQDGQNRVRAGTFQIR